MTQITFTKEDRVKLVDSDNQDVIAAVLADGYTSEGVTDKPKRGRPAKESE